MSSPQTQLCSPAISLSPTRDAVAVAAVQLQCRLVPSFAVDGPGPSARLMSSPPLPSRAADPVALQNGGPSTRSDGSAGQHCPGPPSCAEHPTHASKARARPSRTRDMGLALSGSSRPPRPFPSRPQQIFSGQQPGDAPVGCPRLLRRVLRRGRTTLVSLRRPLAATRCVLEKRLFMLPN